VRGIEKLRVIIAAVALLLFVDAVESPAQERTDCFALSYGAWANRELRWGPPTVPATLRLEGFSRGDYSGTPHGSSPDTAWVRVGRMHRPRFTFWRALESHSLLVVFGTGFGRLELRFAERDGRWTGTAQAIGDVVGNPRPIAPLAAFPVACPDQSLPGAI
jgi:hypothetical protein